MEIKNREVGEFSKEENKLKVRKFGEWFCRGDRGFEECSEEIDLNKIVMFWENGDEEGDCERGVRLNSVEWDVLNGDFGFVDDGFDNCIKRVEKLMNGECIFIEREEEDLVIGVEDGSDFGNKVELFWLEMRKLTLSGRR
jgi:hypothetical protein